MSNGFLLTERLLFRWKPLKSRVLSVKGSLKLACFLTAPSRRRCPRKCTIVYTVRCCTGVCWTRAATVTRLEEFERVKNGVRRKFHAVKHNERVCGYSAVFTFVSRNVDTTITNAQGEAYLNRLGDVLSRRTVTPDTVHVEYTPELVLLSCRR
jgi:hypothetical protein